MFFSLPFLRPKEVSEYFAQDLMAIQPNDKQIKTFCDYVLDNYISLDATFPQIFGLNLQPPLCVQQIVVNPIMLYLTEDFIVPILIFSILWTNYYKYSLRHILNYEVHYKKRKSRSVKKNT